MRNTDRLADAFRGRVTGAGREARSRVGAGVVRGLGALAPRTAGQKLL
jgi:hypothetical protein